MKHIKLTLLLCMLSTYNLIALPYSTARREALFLTDKMAYELNLSHEQYNDVYQINLDYFLNINKASDCTGNYWKYRNFDMSCVLHDFQYTIYKTTSYFLTPIKWAHSAWHHFIYEHYNCDFHYFKKPQCYNSYKGGKWNHHHHAKTHYVNLNKKRPNAGMRDCYHHNNNKANNHQTTHNPHHKEHDKKLTNVNHKNKKTKNKHYPQNITQQKHPQLTTNQANSKRINSTTVHKQPTVTHSNTERNHGNRNFGR